MFNKSVNLTVNRRAYIYTIPPERNCSGTVTAVEYCYKATRPELQQTKDVFYILSLTPSTLGNNRIQFTVNWRININSTASDSICTSIPDRTWHLVCCENKSLEYQFPSSNFTFGILARKYFRLLISTNTTTEYIEQRYFNESVINTATQEGRSFQTYKPINMSLLLLRFHIRYSISLVPRPPSILP